MVAIAHVNIHDAKTHLSRLIQRALDGENIVIAKAGRPLVRLVPVLTDSFDKRRSLGFLKDEIQVSPDFDAPLPDDILDAFGPSGKG